MDKDLFVVVFVDTPEVLKAEVDVWQILVQSMTFVDKMRNVETRVDVQSVNVCQDIRVTHIQDVLEEIVFLILSAEIIKLVKNIDVWTLVNHHVVLELLVMLKTMWLFADVQEVLRVILSKVAVNLPKMKFAKLVVPTLIVKSDKMIGQFVDVKKIILETLSKDADENVIVAEIVQLNKNVYNSNVLLLVEKELVVKMQTVKPEITELNVHALQTS